MNQLGEHVLAVLLCHRLSVRDRFEAILADLPLPLPGDQRRLAQLAAVDENAFDARSLGENGDDVSIVRCARFADPSRLPVS
jgi:hypothetical protein